MHPDSVSVQLLEWTLDVEHNILLRCFHAFQPFMSAMLFNFSSPEHSENSGCRFPGFCWIVPKFLVSWGDVLICVSENERSRWMLIRSWLECCTIRSRRFLCAFTTFQDQSVRSCQNHCSCVMRFRMVGYAEVCSSALFLEGAVAVPRYSKTGTATFFLGLEHNELARNERSTICSLLILAFGITLLAFLFRWAGCR